MKTGRDTAVTWRSASALCSDLGWSLRRLLHEAQHGLPYRTIPPGHVIDWHHPVTAQTFDLDTSEVTIIGTSRGAGVLDATTVGVEFLPPTGEAAVPDLPAPPAPPPDHAPPVSDAALRDCLLAIVRERPDDPLDEETLLEEMETRLGATVARDRVRDARKVHAPHWVLPRGRPRKSAQD